MENVQPQSYREAVEVAANDALLPAGLSAPRVWQVCFVGSLCRAPWDRLLAAGFRHVFLLGFLQEHGLWLCFDEIYGKTEITVLSGERAAYLLAMAEREGDVLHWPAPTTAAPSRLLRPSLWGVSAICQVLGLSSALFTPKGLHRRLKRLGAPSMIGGTHESVQRA
jgi:hypothetical protein